MKLLSEQYILGLIGQAQDALLRDDKRMASSCLDTAGKRILRHIVNARVWKDRAIREARKRIRIAKEKKRLITVNQNLKQRADKNFSDWLEVCEDRALWKTSHRRAVQENEELKTLNERLLNKAYSFTIDDEGVRISYCALHADENMIRMSLEDKNIELLTAIQRLPEPPIGFGDGPDERVGWIMKEIKRLEEEVVVWCKHSQVAWGEVARLKEAFNLKGADLDAFDIQHNYLVMEERLVALRERAELIRVAYRLHLPDYNEAAWNMEGRYFYPQFESYAEYRECYEEQT